MIVLYLFDDACIFQVEIQKEMTGKRLFRFLFGLLQGIKTSQVVKHSDVPSSNLLFTYL